VRFYNKIMSLLNENRYTWQENTRSLDGSISDNNSVQSQEQYYDGSDSNYYIGQNQPVFRDLLIERSDSFCSTCYSEDYTDSE